MCKYPISGLRCITNTYDQYLRTFKCTAFPNTTTSWWAEISRLSIVGSRIRMEMVFNFKYHLFFNFKYSSVFICRHDTHFKRWSEFKFPELYLHLTSYTYCCPLNSNFSLSKFWDYICSEVTYSHLLVILKYDYRLFQIHFRKMSCVKVSILSNFYMLPILL